MGLVWSIPITLPVSPDRAAALRVGEELALVEPDGHVLAILTLADKFTYDKTREAEQVYRTTDAKHPGVAAVVPARRGIPGG